MQKNKDVKVIFSAIADYEEVLAWQNQMWQLIEDGSGGQSLWLGQHHSTITCGRRTNPSHIFADETALKQSGTKLFDIDRGGDVTWHGPGQLVGYPILDLNNFRMDLKWYLKQLERIIVDTLKMYNINSFTVEGKTGVWVLTEGQEKKIASIGIHVSRWITKHGFALNVDPDLSCFKMINPCGLNCEMTSVKELSTDNGPSFDEVREKLAQQFSKTFSCELALCR